MGTWSVIDLIEKKVGSEKIYNYFWPISMM